MPSTLIDIGIIINVWFMYRKSLILTK